MKILEVGKRNNDWQEQLRGGNDNWKCTWKCTGHGGDNSYKCCGAKVILNENDLFITGQHFKKGPTFNVTFTCSQCGVDTDIDNNQVPRETLLLLPVKEKWMERQYKLNK